MIVLSLGCLAAFEIGPLIAERCALDSEISISFTRVKLLRVAARVALSVFRELILDSQRLRELLEFR